MFSFLVHGDVAVEIFKRALLPSYWFISFDLGYKSIRLQVYSLSRCRLNALHRAGFDLCCTDVCDLIKRREHIVLLCVLHTLAFPSVG